MSLLTMSLNRLAVKLDLQDVEVIDKGLALRLQVINLVLRLLDGLVQLGAGADPDDGLQPVFRHLDGLVDEILVEDEQMVLHVLGQAAASVEGQRIFTLGRDLHPGDLLLPESPRNGGLAASVAAVHKVHPLGKDTFE